MTTAAILKFLSLKIMCTHVRQNFWKVSSNSEHHSKPTMNINSQHHNLLGNQISPKSEDFLICVHFGFKMATIANQRWISIRNIIIYLETKFLPNRRIFLFWWPFWIQNGHHSKPTMNINLQHHNLLRNQISPKSEDFCIWQPFCTLVTMATVTILINPPKAATHYGGYSYKVS